MKRSASLFWLAILVIVLLVSSCQPVSRRSQRATATAYAASYMNKAMEAAESGALALCNIDFDKGPNEYLNEICNYSTEMGCEYFSSQIAGYWNELDRSLNSNKVECITGTSRFLEEGRQFGYLVQYWQINLVGTEGWAPSAKNREYWVQVAEEQGLWKFNRVLTNDEIAMYLTIEGMAGEK
jgi:hypothetical protein